MRSSALKAFVKWLWSKKPHSMVRTTIASGAGFTCPIGPELLTQKVMGLSSVKEATLFPRDRKRACP
jgi:aspartyl/asparaginyl-tRNA synthetase